MHCRGNSIGGSAIDKILYSISHSLKTLELSSNDLSEMNGQILNDYAEHNVWVEKINVDENSQVKADHVSNIKKQCMLNM